jgi:hypothetical protein
MQAMATTAPNGPADAGHHEGRILRHSGWDAVLVGLSGVHAVLLLTVPSAPLIAVALWWNANTVAHNFIHAPFFRRRELNVLYSVFLSAVQGIPQTLWRNRHLNHHAGRRRRRPFSPQLAVETGVISALWISIVVFAPSFFATVYLPGYLAGLALCFLQGHFEHAHGTTSHYGWLYNLCFFNDGYHVEHHLRPGEHWTRLPSRIDATARQSTWPPVLRWLDAFSLESLERLVLRSAHLQRFVLTRHESALRKIVPSLTGIERVTIVGGGLFPRTALILRKLLPEASLTIVDKNRHHLDIARGFLSDGVTFRHGVYDLHQPDDADLVVIPLAFVGDREAVYRDAPSRWTLVHDWIWKRHARGVRISWLLLKRLNVVAR